MIATNHLFSFTSPSNRFAAITASKMRLLLFPLYGLAKFLVLLHPGQHQSAILDRFCRISLQQPHSPRLIPSRLFHLGQKELFLVSSELLSQRSEIGGISGSVQRHLRRI
jgi:hypothetical protein